MSKRYPRRGFYSFGKEVLFFTGTSYGNLRYEGNGSSGYWYKINHLSIKTKYDKHSFSKTNPTDVEISIYDLVKE